MRILRWLWGADNDESFRELLTLTPAVWVILAVTTLISVLDFVLPMKSGIGSLTFYLGTAGARVAHGQVWRLLTSALVNPPLFGKHYQSGPTHLITNVVLLILAGVHVERAIGSRRFVALYVVAAVASQVGWFAWSWPLGWQGGGGSSGAVFGANGALLVVALIERRHSRGKHWYFVVAWTLLVLGAVSAPFTNVAGNNIPHLSGAIAGALLAIAWLLPKPSSAPRVAVATALTMAVISVSLVAPKSVWAASTDRAVRDSVRLPIPPSLVYSAFGSLWSSVDASEDGNGALVRVDPVSRRVVATITSPSVGGGMVAVVRSLWVTGAHSVVEVDPARNRVVSKIRVPGKGPWGLAAWNGTLWAALPDKESVARIDLRARRVAIASVGREPYDVLANKYGVWATSWGSREVSRLDERTGRVLKSVHVASTVYWLEFTAGSLWVSGSNAIYRFDPGSLRVLSSIPVTDEVPWTMTTDQTGRLWVTQRYGFGLFAIDPKTNKITRRLRVGLGQPNGVIATAHALWVADTYRRELLEIKP